MKYTEDTLGLTIDTCTSSRRFLSELRLKVVEKECDLHSAETNECVPTVLYRTRVAKFKRHCAYDSRHIETTKGFCSTLQAHLADANEIHEKMHNAAMLEWRIKGGLADAGEGLFLYTQTVDNGRLLGAALPAWKEDLEVIHKEVWAIFREIESLPTKPVD
jgi:hypothetical protein